eukprot:2572823-Rhodomonas_salina.4
MSCVRSGQRIPNVKGDQGHSPSVYDTAAQIVPSASSLPHSQSRFSRTHHGAVTTLTTEITVTPFPNPYSLLFSAPPQRVLLSSVRSSSKPSPTQHTNYPLSDVITPHPHDNPLCCVEQLRKLRRRLVSAVGCGTRRERRKGSRASAIGRYPRGSHSLSSLHTHPAQSPPFPNASLHVRRCGTDSASG